MLATVFFLSTLFHSPFWAPESPVSDAASPAAQAYRGVDWMIARFEVRAAFSAFERA